MRKGFTLIELLVVIAIIAILAAILFPVFAKAREKARQSSCLSNVKQLSLAFMQYAQDYDESLPGMWQTNTAPGISVTWQNIVDAYIKNTQVLYCPSNKGGRGYGMTYDTTSATTRRGVGSYLTYNGTFWGSASLGDIKRPAEIVMVADCWPGHIYIPHMGSGAWLITVDANGDGTPEASGWGTAQEWWYNGMEPRHNEGANVGFCDGHAKWINKMTYSNAAFWPSINS